MEQSKTQAKKFAYSTDAHRFQYIGGPNDIWRFVYKDGTDVLKTGAELQEE